MQAKYPTNNRLLKSREIPSVEKILDNVQIKRELWPSTSMFGKCEKQWT